MKSQPIVLSGKTSIHDLMGILKRCAVVITNDTGPMHMIAAASVPSLVLFSADSDPARNAPRGKIVHILQRPNLADLSTADVFATLAPMLPTSS